MILVAFRNILRNRRRTAITLFLIVSGTFLVTAMRFIAYGLTQDMIAHVLQLDSGYVEVAAYGWKERPSLSRALEVTPELLQKLKVRGIQNISPRIQNGALLSYQEKTRFISVVAADPVLERKITTLQNKIREGTPPGDATENHMEIRGAMIGDRLARTTGLKIGSTFYLISSQFDGSLGAIRAQVSGIYHANESRLDSSRVYLTLKGGEELFDTESENRLYYTTIALGVPDYLEAEEAKKELQKIFPPPVDRSGLRPDESNIFDPVVLDWKELNPAMMEMVGIATMKMDIYLIFFIVSISFGVLNTVQMSIQERIREFGILMAIGTKPLQLLWMIAFEIFFLLVPGVLLGVALAAGVGSYYHQNPIQLYGSIAEVYQSMGFSAQLRPIVDIKELLFTGMALIVPAYLIALFSVRRVYRLDPIRVINTI